MVFSVLKRMMSLEMELEKKKILILAANPKTTPRLRLDEEVREIEEGLRRSKHRDRFEIHSVFAVRLKDLRRALLDYEPVIVHFSGHGKEAGLLVEDDMGLPVLINAKALSGLFALFSGKVECVILSACYSAHQAKAIGKHIDYVIGMRKKIKDKAAIEFAIGFYDALGAGRTVDDAFNFGRNAILQQFPDSSAHLVPIFKKRENKDETIAGRTVPSKSTTNDRPITLAIRSFKHPAHEIKSKVDHMLCLCDHFDGRHLVKGTWEEVIQEIKDFIYRTIKAEHRYNLYLPLHTSLAFLVGRTMDPKYGAEINIFQPAFSTSVELWRLKQSDSFKGGNPWTVEEPALGNPGNELAAAVSVTHNVLADVEGYIKNQPPGISPIIHLKLTELGQPRPIKDESHAYAAAYKAVEILRDKYRQSGASKLNLFLAAPNVFTFMLGQQSLLLPGNITLYEYDFDSKELGAYIPTFTLK
jgi:hypothetical protein